MTCANDSRRIRRLGKGGGLDEKDRAAAHEKEAEIGEEMENGGKRANPGRSNDFQEKLETSSSSFINCFIARFKRKKERKKKEKVLGSLEGKIRVLEKFKKSVLLLLGQTCVWNFRGMRESLFCSIVSMVGFRFMRFEMDLEKLD